MDEFGGFRRGTRMTRTELRLNVAIWSLNGAAIMLALLAVVTAMLSSPHSVYMIIAAIGLGLGSWPLMVWDLKLKRK